MQLSIENTQCGDRGTIAISESLRYNNSLTSLNLSHCEITDLGTSSLADLLEANNILQILILHWNKIGSKSACYLAKALTINETLKVFDASFNGMDSVECAQNFKEVFANNRALIHIDLSNNGFKSENIKTMSKYVI
jgi:Leucine-rich repeat (LRR) protein